MIERVGQQPLSTVHSQRQETSSPGVSFDAALRQQMQAQEGQVSFSKHAMARAEERGIQVTTDLLEKLHGSVEKALALDSSLAFIINVPNSRVITTMSQDEMKENIFTNIDGAVIL